MKILHLYYDLMNLYGEYGNVVVLKKHLQDQGIEVVVEKKTIGDKINFSDYDFIYCGSGSERNQKVALYDLLKYKDSLKEAINNNCVALFTGNSMELLGESIDELEALKLLPITTTSSKQRYTGDVVVENKEIGEVVGFINKCTLIKENKDISLFTYIFKDSNLEDNEYEGYRLNNLFATHIIGPVLVKNPNFMKKIVSLLVDKEGLSYQDIRYPFEEDSYNVTLNALKGRMK